jgi:hypothetical protein
LKLQADLLQTFFNISVILSVDLLDLISYMVFIVGKGPKVLDNGLPQAERFRRVTCALVMAVT